MRFDEKLKKYSREQLWQEYCGYLDMTLPEYMYTQRRLMEEQIRLWSACPLGRQLLAGKHPETLEDFLAQQRARQSTPPHVIIDTVMGDGGKIYPTYTPDMCRLMRRLVSHADVITPNVTEACILTGTPYSGEELTTAQARELACRLYDLGAGAVVITGIVREPVLCNLVYDGRELYFDAETRTERMFSGTGDLFASIVRARLAAGGSLPEAVSLAGSFIAAATRYTLSRGTPAMEGVCFEPCLSRLVHPQSQEK